MTVFELVRQEITAKQAAELYGLRFDRAGRGFCPWHEDGKHAALQFFPDGGCYCHSCHAYGDAIDITAAMLKLKPKLAAWLLYKDFHLNQPVDRRPNPETKRRAQQQRDAKAEFNKRWCYLCDVVHEAKAKLATYTPETIDAEFNMLLSVMAKADTELDLMWEAAKYERA